MSGKELSPKPLSPGQVTERISWMEDPIEEQLQSTLGSNRWKAEVCHCPTCINDAKDSAAVVAHWDSCNGTGIDPRATWMPDPDWAIPNEVSTE